MTIVYIYNILYHAIYIYNIYIYILKITGFSGCSPKKSPTVTGQKRLALGAVAAWSGGMVETARQPLQGPQVPWEDASGKFIHGRIG